MTKTQASKRSRKHRKQARFAFGNKLSWISHPSHISGRRRSKRKKAESAGSSNPESQTPYSNENITAKN